MRRLVAKVTWVTVLWVLFFGAVAAVGAEAIMASRVMPAASCGICSSGCGSKCSCNASSPGTDSSPCAASTF
jgi:hypothetical protein